MQCGPKLNSYILTLLRVSATYSAPKKGKLFFEYVDNAISGYKDENCVDPSATSSSTTSLSSTSTSTSTIAKLEVVINTFNAKESKIVYFQQNVNTVTAVDCDAIVCAIECRNSETCIAWTLSPHHSLIEACVDVICTNLLVHHLLMIMIIFLDTKMNRVLILLHHQPPLKPLSLPVLC